MKSRKRSLAGVSKCMMSLFRNQKEDNFIFNKSHLEPV